jgi:hypothetical protein
MSDTPLFDAVLAESDPDIFLASTVFPIPKESPETTDTGATL